MSKPRWTLMLLLLSSTAAAQPVRVASKNFTESVILGEMITLLIRDAGIDATH